MVGVVIPDCSWHSANFAMLVNDGDGDFRYDLIWVLHLSAV